jgi:ATP-dependent helicase HepA
MENNISSLLHKSSVFVSSYLEEILPELFDNWWHDSVLSALSFHQRQRIEQSKIKSLASLDLAALLRVLDQNWYKISMKTNQSKEL